MTKRIAYALLTAGAFGLLLSSPLAAEWTDEEVAAGLKRAEYTRHVISGNIARLQFLVAVNPDCSLADGYQFSLTKEPEHGTVDFVPYIGFATYAKDNVRAKCNDKKLEGHMLSYKPKDGYVGVDSFTFLELFPSGMGREITFRMNVRPVKPKTREAVELPRPRP